MAEENQHSLVSEIDAARLGDVSGLWEASEGMRPYLRAVAAGVLRGRVAGKVDASDVVQQSLMASIERFEQFRGTTRSEWKRWLVVIVRNEAKNLLRYWHQDRRGVHQEDAIAGSLRVQRADAETGAERRLESGEESPSQRMQRREDASRLLQVVDRLPPDYREVVRMRHLEGLSHDEIAAQLGKSPAAVRQTWVRALRRMREGMA